jgi:hypothetical protein
MTNEKVDTQLPIIIDNFTGGESGKDLKGCYFKLKESKGTYDFHDKDDKEKCKDLTVGSGCSFVLDENPHITWRIVLTPPCSELVVNGGWSNTVRNDVGEEGGTFQAQAGGGLDAEASAASASGY